MPLMPYGLSEDKILELPSQSFDTVVEQCDVFIAGSGIVAATYARKILDWGNANSKHPRIIMAEIGSKEGDITGGHLRNSIKYQKDIDMFASLAHVISGALQPVSVAISDNFEPTLGGAAWAPPRNHVIHGFNPQQNPDKNLKGASVTRTVGGMGTHWSCACPIPHKNERVELHKVIPEDRMNNLLDEAGTLLNVHQNVYDDSIRHNLVKDGLTKAFEENFPGRNFHSVPLAVERRVDNPDYVTWTATNTILGPEWIKVLDDENNNTLTLFTETRVTRVGQLFGVQSQNPIEYALIRDLNNNKDRVVVARAFVLACGAIPTPQILWASRLATPILGHYLTEQSPAYCQIILKKEFIDSVDHTDPRVTEHNRKHPLDTLPIPFNDLEPQWMIPYSTAFPWHIQIHRDPFYYNEIGPRADPRTVIDLRFFGKGDLKWENSIQFGSDEFTTNNGWKAGVTDIYGMPQVTFNVTRTDADRERDQRMMKDMTTIANYLGSYLPGSFPQFTVPGRALHITGTTRIGINSETSVADSKSRVHGYPNLWVGGNGCLPDATASNPTRTSVAIALEGAQSVIDYIANIIN